MDTKRGNPISDEELEQVRKAMEEFGSAPVVPVQNEETPATPVKAEEKPAKKSKRWIVWIAAAVAVALIAGIGYGYWAGLPYHHPNSMANRNQTVEAEHAAVAILNDGSVQLIGSSKADTSQWQNIVSVSLGAQQAVGLRQDGTVVFNGNEAYGKECEQWTDMRAVSAGDNYVVGLCSDGKVVAVGRNEYGQCEVSKWRNIVGIAAGRYFTAGLRADGKVEVTEIRQIVSNLPSGSAEVDTTNQILEKLIPEMEAVEQWRDIISISVTDTCILGLKEDGTVVAAGINDNGQCNVQDWTDMVWVDAGLHISVGIRSDGTVLAVGGEQLPYWPDPDAPETSPQTMSEAIEALAAEYAVVAIWSHAGGNIHFLCEDGKLYRVSSFLINDASMLRVHEALTDVRLP